MADKEKQEDFRVDIPGDEKRPYSPARSSSAAPVIPSVSASPSAAIISYCAASILMTLTNKYVLSGLDFNLNFLLLCVQVCYHAPAVRCGFC
jgi:GDP-mannose transporter